MGKVIGPITWDDWYLLRQLRESVAFMKERNPEKYKIAIQKEGTIYNKVLGDVSRVN